MRWVQTSLLILLACLPATGQASSFLERQLRYPRVRAAHQMRGHLVEAEFRKANAQWPPANLMLRGFKLEGRLEVWSASAENPDALTMVRSYPICASSGVLGPKMQSGDGQVPEGVYHIDRFNPRSSFHLSLGLNYPNAIDRVRSKGRDPGGDIFVHGDCVTIGCLPLRNGPMEDLYLSAVYARSAGQRRIPTHIFPCDFSRTECVQALRRNPTHHWRLWNNLRQVQEEFLKRPRFTRIRARANGTYTTTTHQGKKRVSSIQSIARALAASPPDSTHGPGKGPGLPAPWNQRRSNPSRRHGLF